jgi:hypothetical protein
MTMPMGMVVRSMIVTKPTIVSMLALVRVVVLLPMVMLLPRVRLMPMLVRMVMPVMIVLFHSGHLTSLAQSPASTHLIGQKVHSYKPRGRRPRRTDIAMPHGIRSPLK